MGFDPAQGDRYPHLTHLPTMSPDAIGPYRVVRRLGHGGMGEVSLAYDDRLKRHVALKSLLPRDRESDSGSYDALLREARAAASLSHNGIASIYDIVEERDRAYIVMEYVEGETLAAWLRQGPFPPNEAIQIGVQLCDALSVAHARQIIHRDLKPGNIMLGPDRKAKILDFGLAKHVPVSTPSASTLSAASSTLSATSSPVGGLVGTVGYISPEQMIGDRIDHRCDLFSLGAVLFEMVTGRRPFLERDGLAYALAATRGSPPHASDVNASVPPALSAVIARALSTKPADRHQDAAELARDLRAAALAETVTMPATATVPAPAPATWAHPRSLGWLAAVAAIVIALVSYVAYPRSTSPPGVAGAPVVMAVLPVRTLSVDESSQAVGAGVTATVIANLSGTTGLNVIPFSAVAPLAAAKDRDTALKTLGVTWALEMALRQDAGRFALDASLKQTGADAAAWQATVTGDELTTEKRLLTELAQGLVSAEVIERLSASERSRIVASPTNDNAAFVAYSRARYLLGRPWSATTAQEMIPLFESAVTRDPQYSLAYAGLAEAYFAGYRQTKDAALVDKATEAANKALGLDPNQAAVQQALANILMQTGRLADALAAVDRAIALQPASDDAQRMRGRILATQSRFDDAVAALSRAIELNPNRMNNHETMAFVLYQAGRIKEAADSYRRVTEIAPNFAAGYQMLGTMQHMLGDTTQAIGNYEHAVRLGPSATAYANLAYSYYEVGRLNEALDAYKTAIERDPKTPVYYRNIGDVYARLGRTREAREAYESVIARAAEGLKVNPNDATTIALVALCEAKLGRAAAAERHAAEALALRSKDWNVMAKNAEVFARLKQPGRAIEYLRQAIALGYDRAAAAKNEEFESLKALPAYATVIAAAPPPPQP